MRKKIEDKILEILKKHKELEALAIAKEIGLTYDTTSKYLKKIAENGIIERKAKGKPWTYYYILISGKKNKKIPYAAQKQEREQLTLL